MKVGDLVRVGGSAIAKVDGIENKIGVIVGRDGKSDVMRAGRDGDFFYMLFYRVFVDGKIYRFEKDNLEKII